MASPSRSSESEESYHEEEPPRPPKRFPTTPFDDPNQPRSEALKTEVYSRTVRGMRQKTPEFFNIPSRRKTRSDSPNLRTRMFQLPVKKNRAKSEVFGCSGNDVCSDEPPNKSVEERVSDITLGDDGNGRQNERNTSNDSIGRKEQMTEDVQTVESGIADKPVDLKLDEGASEENVKVEKKATPVLEENADPTAPTNNGALGVVESTVEEDRAQPAPKKKPVPPKHEAPQKKFPPQVNARNETSHFKDKQNETRKKRQEEIKKKKEEEAAAAARMFDEAEKERRRVAARKEEEKKKAQRRSNANRPPFR